MMQACEKFLDTRKTDAPGGVGFKRKPPRAEVDFDQGRWTGLACENRVRSERRNSDDTATAST